MKEMTPREVSALPSNNLVNLSSSILHRFGVTPFHKTIPEIDALFARHDKIAVFLFDGMGEWILNNHPKAGKLFLDNRFTLISSTNPATTVAATTAFLTGKYPIETGWLGWSLPLREYNEPMICFTSASFLDGRPLGDRVMDRICPTEKIDSLINKAGHRAELLLQYGVGGNTNGPKTYKESVPMASRFFKEGGEFLYIYFNTPDGYIHHHGVKGKEVDDCISSEAEAVEAFVRENPDVLTLVIADHGLIDIHEVDLNDYPEIMDCMRMPFSLEGRTCNFLLKEGREGEFLRLMKEKLPQFRLMSREEALKSHYFGEGTPHPRSASFLGDYIAIAEDDSLIVDPVNVRTNAPMKAHHAGPSAREKNIVVAAFNK
ncbi:MAG: alkaline phosphatase family protein [Bacilli bacterium]|nr:alkaline phosphatase family protein [Bacilli bacterium]